MLKKIALASLFVVSTLLAATSYASATKSTPSSGKSIVNQPAPKGMCWPAGRPC